jgi:hypothetical protein
MRGYSVIFSFGESILESPYYPQKNSITGYLKGEGIYDSLPETDDNCSLREEIP